MKAKKALRTEKYKKLSFQFILFFATITILIMTMMGTITINLFISVSEKYIQGELMDKMITETERLYGSIEAGKEELKGILLEQECSRIERMNLMTQQLIYNYQEKVKNKELTEAKAQEAVKEYLASLTFNEGEGYYFIFKSDGTNILEKPIKETNISTLKDKDGNEVGKAIITDAMDAAKLERQGRTKHMWAMPGFDSLNFMKQSVSFYVSDWDWIIGSGVYLDTVDTQANTSGEENLEKIKVVLYEKSFFGKDNYPTVIDDTGDIVLSKKIDFLKAYIEMDYSTKTKIFDMIKAKDKGVIRYRTGTGEYKILKYHKKDNKFFIVSIYEKELYSEVGKVKLILIFITILITLIIVISVYFLFKYKIENQIKFIMSIIKKAETGDLTVRIKSKEHNEFGQLSKGIDNFLFEMSNVVNNIKSLSYRVYKENDTISNDLTEIVMGSTQSNNSLTGIENMLQNISDNVSSQTAASEESLASLEEISATSDVVQENANNTLKISSDTVREINFGRERIQKMITEIKTIEKMIYEVESKTATLVDFSDNITNILQSISTISEQTNLLALNAAIEAARAGEAGRGFAVVASEIKKLAEGTQKESEKIEGITIQIKAKVNDNQKATSKVVQIVKNGVSYAAEVEKSIYSILVKASETDKKVSEIESSMKEQALASSEIMRAVGNITQSSAVISSFSDDTLHTTQDAVKKIKEKLEMIKDIKDISEKLYEDLKRLKTE